MFFCKQANKQESKQAKEWKSRREQAKAGKSKQKQTRTCTSKHKKAQASTSKQASKQAGRQAGKAKKCFLRFIFLSQMDTLLEIPGGIEIDSF